MAPPTPLPSFTGRVYLRGTSGYTAVCPQYASLNQTGDQSMQPFAIIRPAGDEDVKAAVTWARQNKVAVAVRTGGHQYSGASSTFGDNIQLDLCNTYTDIDWLDSTTLQVGVSRKLLSLNEELRAKNAFVPHGQCSHVNIGGHCHTGGYGLPGRAFGLFGDNIVAIRVITADGKDGSCSDARWIERGTQDPQDAELFWAVLGGSPGNFAVLTDIRLKVHDGSLYPKARGIKLTGAFTEGAYRALLNIKAKMAADTDLPADFDFCITVLSGPSQNDTDTVSRFPDSGDASAAAAAAAGPAAGSAGSAGVAPHRPPVEKFGMMSGDDYAAFLKTDAGKLMLDMNQKEFMAHAQSKAAAVDPQPTAIVPVPVIIVFAEWANLGGAAQSDDGVVEWLQSIRACFPTVPILGTPILITDESWGPDTPDNGQPRGMPFLTSQWVFPLKREYDGMPYDKRTYTTTATNLDTSGWVDFTVKTTQDLAWDFPPPFGIGNCVAVQIQHYGGTQSRFKTNDPDRKTSYSWRDTTVVMTMDAFYPPNSDSQAAAKTWQAANDTAYKGPSGNFSPGEDRRLLWASYEAQGTDELNLSKYWHFYHEDQAKWTRLQTIKSRVDPDNVLTPNQFAVTPLGSESL